MTDTAPTACPASLAGTLGVFVPSPAIKHAFLDPHPLCPLLDGLGPLWGAKRTSLKVAREVCL